MSNVIYVKPIYHFEGKWSLIEKEKAKKLFMDIRKDYIDVVNPKIESINEEWNRLYPDANLEDEDTFFDYTLFVCNHENHLIGDIHREFRGYFDPRIGGDFVMINRSEGWMYAEYEMI